MPPGTYTTAEVNLPTHWYLSDIVLDDGSSTNPSTCDMDAKTATFNLDPGETVKAIFTNRYSPPEEPADEESRDMAVGIDVYPVNRAELLAPLLALFVAAAIVGFITIRMIRRNAHK